VSAVSRRRVSAQQRRAYPRLILYLKPSQVPTNRETPQLHLSYLLPAPHPQSYRLPHPFRPRLFAPPSNTSSHQTAKPIDRKTPAIPAVSEDVVGCLTKMLVKPPVRNSSQPRGEMHIVGFHCHRAQGAIQVRPSRRPSACMHMPCDRVIPLPRATSPSRLALLVPTSTIVSIPTLIPMWAHTLRDRARSLLLAPLGALRPRSPCAATHYSARQRYPSSSLHL
jgi:hypothetical protein